MNEHQLRKLFHRMLLLSAPLPLAVSSVACGGSASIDQSGSAGASATGGTGSSGTGSSGTGSGGTGSGGGTSGNGGEGNGGATAGAGGGDSACRNTALLPCGGGLAAVPKSCIDSSLTVVGTSLPMATCTEICSGGVVGPVTACSVTAVDATSVTVQCVTGCITGRRPAGLSEPVVGEWGGIGGYFAELARLEAASVTAFRIMRDELRSHGAPKKLVRAAARAARDEIRHTRATGALARRFGAQPTRAAVERGAVRSIEAMAIENAVEGCVRETYGALLASRQAQLARDPGVRAAMMRIARDETRHASLSWQVGLWLKTRLNARAERRVERAKQAAIRELLGSVARDEAGDLAELVGLPSPAEARQLAEKMNRRLWS